MANSFLTPTAITREFLRILHNNLTFTKNANRQYNKDFANSGASMSGKIGTSLRVRMPNKYSVRSGATINVQDQAETYKTINCTTQKGIDMAFSSTDLTLTIDEFSERYIKPAALTLASTIDYDGLQLYKDIYNTVGTYNAVPSTVLAWLQGNSKMTDMCCPLDPRMAVMTPLTSATMVNALSGQYNPQSNISEMFIKGQMSNAAGLKWAYSQNIATHTCGTRAASGESTVNDTVASGDSEVTIATGNGVTFKAGDVFYFASGTAVNWVNPELKHSTGNTAYFTVTSDVTATGTAATLNFSPAIVTSGPTQNVTAVPDNGAAIVFVGATGSTYKANLIYHPDAFALVTADLVLPKGVDFAAREVFDGVSVRIIRQYDINNDSYPCRLDIFYGWTTLYPEFACRHVGA